MATSNRGREVVAAYTGPRAFVLMAHGSAPQLALPPMPLGVGSHLLAPQSMSLQPLRSSLRAGHAVEFLQIDLSCRA